MGLGGTQAVQAPEPPLLLGTAKDVQMSQAGTPASAAQRDPALWATLGQQHQWPGQWDSAVCQGSWAVRSGDTDTPLAGRCNRMSPEEEPGNVYQKD
ncbi:hypothetical protein TREES_T100016001 [Tupaia chinensis]|uniref:Uncharacterized protein n=1 Tax=Tupaia chinensis TaxID=246437 RepID=L9KL38_TUPCH|nr:hypothetical protein TREES_T100016001 [Tupaia chinensis]